MSRSIYPEGATNANWFNLCNAIAFQITLGSPMILYAKTLGASATVLGVIAAMTPLLTICQIPAAHYLARFGYRRFVLMGWGLRTLFVFAIAAIPLLSFLERSAKIQAVLLCLFAFNLLRGISSGAWLPWITDLIPEDVRGRFLSRDQLFTHVGSLGGVCLSAFALHGNPEPWQFAAIFLLSASGGSVSLLFLNRIPDIEQGETLRRSNVRVPWKAIITYPPFLRLCVFNLLFVLTLGGVGVFTIAFLKSTAHLEESTILYLTSLQFIGAMLTLPFIGPILDRIGNKPIMTVGLWLLSAIVLGWVLLAARILPSSHTLIGALFFASGIAGSNFGVANVRMTMETMPPMGRSHFFAFFSVITSLGLGLSPLLAGIGIDWVGSFEAISGPVHWNKYSLFFSSVLLLLAVTLAYCRRLPEKPEYRGRTTDRTD